MVWLIALGDLFPIILGFVGFSVVAIGFCQAAAMFVQESRLGDKSFEELKVRFEQDLPSTGVTIFATDSRFGFPPSLVAVNLDNELSSIYHRNGKIRFESGLQGGLWIVRPISRFASPGATRFLSFRRANTRRSLKHNFEVLSASEETLPEWSFWNRAVRLSNGALVNGER